MLYLIHFNLFTPIINCHLGDLTTIFSPLYISSLIAIFTASSTVFPEAIAPSAMSAPLPIAIGASTATRSSSSLNSQILPFLVSSIAVKFSNLGFSCSDCFLFSLQLMNFFASMTDPATPTILPFLVLNIFLNGY